MIDLFLSILASTLIFLIFKLFDRFKINTLQAIVFNYITACFCGVVTSKKQFQVQEIIHSEWFYGALILGFLFISIFNVMAITSQRNGLSVASVATKMSVIIPVIFGIYVYNESTGFQKLLGIFLALFAVYFVSVKKDLPFNFKSNLMFPLIIFIGSGIIDTSIKYIETTYIEGDGIPLFSATIFFFAGCIGIGMLIIKMIRKEFKFNPPSILGGIALGIANYASIYFILKALNHESLESSTIFTINNVAIVLFTSLVGLIFFKEKLSFKNWIGVGLAIISILLVTLA
ncbi:GRP family sugar transporter [Xanthomarina sp. F2636L]|uniref:GRP family sugar transporter n=1 Tax=Xanthomarina sp. F2636L TaxID=2996018 RepID=UPI00225DD5BC|nr:GRP family sugar transporter [Xanthomarina sp. F2636L]MCX7552205.1 GRP family sugar transporter [Xanthomarina sp. F2636L]